MRIIEVKEHEALDLDLVQLAHEGGISFDARIADKGYFILSIKGGRIRIQSTRFVGLIPLNTNVSVRVIPKAPIKNLAELVLKSGYVPHVVSGFKREYIPQFAYGGDPFSLYLNSFLLSARRIVERGLLKKYEVSRNSSWEGRLLLSDTIRTYTARGVRYRALSETVQHSTDVLENRILKYGLRACLEWARSHREKAVVREILGMISHFERISELTDVGTAVNEVPALTANIRRWDEEYVSALWLCYAFFQKAALEMEGTGHVPLDSLIVDVSAAFEAFVRRSLAEALRSAGFRVVDGNCSPIPFFSDEPAQYRVKPDIMVYNREGECVAVFDVKYKPQPKEQDRYELLSFMEASGVTLGGFICPETDDDVLFRKLGSTLGGKQMFLLRLGLTQDDMSRAEHQLGAKVLELITKQHPAS